MTKQKEKETKLVLSENNLKIILGTLSAFLDKAYEEDPHNFSKTDYQIITEAEDAKKKIEKALEIAKKWNKNNKK